MGARARRASSSQRGLRVNPDPPHTNTFEVFAEGDADAINERAIAFMEREQRPAVRRLACRPVPGLAT